MLTCLTVIIMSLVLKSKFEPDTSYGDVHNFLDWSTIIYIINCLVALILFCNGRYCTSSAYARLTIFVIYTLLYSFYISIIYLGSEATNAILEDG